LYNTIGSNYANVTKLLAKALVDQGQVDPSQYLNAVLTPYGLPPQLSDPTLRSKVQAVLAAQIDQKSAALAMEQQTASTNMAEALREMASRIHLVAIDKAMTVRTAPITLAEVQHWISLVPQIATTTAAKPSTSTTVSKSN
jgi:hypothetical protein